MRDPHWRPAILFPTLLAQFLLLAIMLGLACPDGRSFSSLTPNFSVTTTSLSIVSLVAVGAQVGCFFTARLRPVLVLAGSIFFMLAWVVVIAYVVVMMVFVEVHPSIYEGGTKEYWTTSGMAAVGVCVLLSYMWLVAYAAVVRKYAVRTAVTGTEGKEQELTAGPQKQTV